MLDMGVIVTILGAVVFGSSQDWNTDKRRMC